MRDDNAKRLDRLPLEAAADQDNIRASPGLTCPICERPLVLDTPEHPGRLICAHCGQRLHLTTDPLGSFGLHPGMEIDRFQLVHLLGRGGFGSVWRAIDTRLDRTVAIKVPNEVDLTPLEAELFLREARAGSQVRHPNVVPVHEVGRHGDLLYLITDWIDGETLEQRVKRGPVRWSQALSWCETIARALHAVHLQGVVHRDLKPSNILLDRDEIPYLTDFGLARRDQGELSITDDGQLMGTVAYLSPEQVQGTSATANPRSDIFSLGTLLYRLITGELPFRGAPHVILKQIAEADPISPTELNPRVPRDLVTVCLKCLEKDPVRRFASAGELADELVRIRRGEPIRSRRVSRLRQSLRWMQRHPLQIASVLLLAIIGTLGPLLALRERFALNLAREAQQRAVDLATKASQKEALARRLVYATQLAQANDALFDGDVQRAIRLLEQQIPETNQTNSLGFEWRHLWKRCHQHLRATVRLDHPIDRIAVSPDQSRVVVVANSVLSHRVQCVAWPTGKLVWEHVHSSGTQELEFDSAGQYVVMADEQGSLHILNLDNGSVQNSLEAHQGGTRSIDYCVARSVCFSGGADGFIRGWSLPTCEKASEWPLPSNLICGCLAVTNDGASLAVVGMHPDERHGIHLLMFDVATATLRWQQRLERTNDRRTTVTFTPDGRRVAVAGENEGNQPCLWDVATGSRQRLSADCPFSCSDVEFSPSGKLLSAFAERTGNVYFWDTGTSQRLDCVLPHERLMDAVWLDDASAITAGRDGCLRHWEVTSATQCRERLPGVDGRIIWRCDRSTDRQTFSTVSNLDRLQIWNLDERRMLSTLDDLVGASAAVCREAIVYSTTADNRAVMRYDAGTHSAKRAYQIDHPSARIHDVAVSPDDKRLIVAVGPRASVTGEEEMSTVVIIHCDTAKIVRMDGVGKVANYAYRLAFSNDPTRLFVLDTAHGLEGWDINRSRQLFRIDSVIHESPGPFIVSNDTRWASIGGELGNVSLVDLAQRRKIHTLPGRGKSTRDLMFSRDGLTIVAAYGNSDANRAARGEIRFWDVETGQPILELGGELAPCTGLALSADECHMVSTHFDGSIWAWDGANDATVAEQRSRIPQMRMEYE